MGCGASDLMTVESREIDKALKEVSSFQRKGGKGFFSKNGLA
jgi:hypothetical protein